MSEGSDINVTRDLVGNAINNNTGQITNNYISYQQAQPQYVDPTTLADAQQLLATLPLDRIPNPAPLPSNSRMLFARNPLFTGREHELMELARTLKNTEATTVVPVAAITGMGGVGKTQLAAEFAHRYGQFFAGGVFWLSFADSATVPMEIAACSGQSDLRVSSEFGRQSLPEQLAAAGAAWNSPLPRLLIFDNCEDEDLLKQWEPKTGGCRILITSRRSHWNKALGVNRLPLAVFQTEESVALLRNYRPDLPSDSSDLHSIADELGHLPLALNLAGNFLSDYQYAIDPPTYLEQLRSSDLLQHQSLIPRGYSPTEYREGLERAIALAYQGLDAGNAVDQQARDLLARAAYLVPGELIPRDLLMAVVEPVESTGSYQFVHALKRLVDTGLLEEVGGDTFRIHRLVVAFVRTATNDTTVQQAIEDGLIRFATRLKEGGYPAPLRVLLPHLKEITDRALEREDSQSANLCNILAESLVLIGDYTGAELYAKQGLMIREQVLGPDHPDTAYALSNMAGVLQTLGDYLGARPLYVRALAIREEVLGPDHPDTARSLNNLASVLHELGDYTAVRPLLERALVIREQILGPDHRDTANSIDSLASLLKTIGEYSIARSLFERALAIREEVLGSNHPGTATSLNNLALLLQDLGDYTAARPLFERALVIYEQALGLDHPHTATSLNNLALLLRNIGDYTAARPLFERALVIYEQALGLDHPYTAGSLDNLASLLRYLGDYTAARPLFERALAIKEQVLGPDHPGTATSLNNLALLLQDLGDYTAARPLYERALTIHERILGPHHRETAATLNNLGTVLYNLHDYMHAKPLLERALDIFGRAFGMFHPDTFPTLVNLAQIHMFHGNRLQARMYFTRALDTLERNPSLKNVSEQLIRRQLGQIGGPFRNIAKPKSKPKRKK